MTRKVLTGTSTITITFLDHEKKLKTRKGRKYFFNTNLTNDTKSINGNDNVNDNFFRSRKKLKTRKGHEKSFRIISVFSNGLLYASHSDRWFGINKNTNRTNDTKSINDNFFRSRKKLKTRKGRK